jgi:pimeloyl-ACP methyl ester carboxylesterase
MKRIIKGLVILLVLAVIALLAWGWESDRDPAVLRAKYSNAASQFVDVGSGLTMHVRDEGKRDGPVLVLLHGSNSSLQTWEPWVARLGGKYRVISFDQIGHGLTGPNPAHDYSAKAFVDTADALLTKMGVQKFALGGNSMGGWVAWHYALAHSEKLTALILVDAAGAPNSESKSVPLGFKIARMPVFKTLMLHVTPRGVFDKTVHQTLSNDAIITDKMIDTYWELALYPGNRQATGERFATPRVPIDEAAIHALKVPTLVMWGDEDTLIPVSASHWFAKAIPGAKEIVYPHIGHIPMEEAADQSAKDVDAFLSGLGTGGKL